MKRLLITGASGLLGINLGLAVADDYRVVGTVNNNPLTGAPFEVCPLDLSRPGAARQVVQTTAPDIIINCAALANIDQCENDPHLAQRLNEDMPAELAEAARTSRARLVHISTDAVFDGTRDFSAQTGSGGGYTEQDTPNPINVYARTKLAGEKAVLAANPSAIVARVNFYGWSLRGKRSLAEFFFNNLAAGSPVKGFTDVFFCPLLVNDLAIILLEMVAKDLQGVYHVINAEHISKYAFGCLLARQFGFDEKLVNPVSWMDGGLQAVRSPNLILQPHKLVRDLGHGLPGQLESMQHFHALWSQGYVNRIHRFAS